MSGVVSCWWVTWWHPFLYLAFMMNRSMNVLTGKGQDTWCGTLTDLQFDPWIWFRSGFLDTEKWTLTVGLIFLGTASVSATSLRPNGHFYSFSRNYNLTVSFLQEVPPVPYACDLSQTLRHVTPTSVNTLGHSENAHPLSPPRKAFFPLSAVIGDNFRCRVINSIPLIADSAVGRFPFQTRILFYVFVFFSHKRGKFC